MTTAEMGTVGGVEQAGAQRTSAVSAVLHFAARLLSPLPDVAPAPGQSEHFGHSDKRNDTNPQWSTQNGYVG
ncbi:MAG: hypothetical protein JWO47_560 [Candidatus Saccharibacteria bacterium]|nr:hypothetical protein [Candidatus Saccharibacteria bacterium]